MSIINLIVNGIEVPLGAAESINQKYEPLASEGILRTMDGTAIKQVAWSGKTRIETTGTGRLPLPLQDIDYGLSFVMQCASPIEKQSASNIIVLPTNRRADVSPVGYAIVNGREVRTPLSLTGDTATLTVVTGANGYVVAYWPTFTVFGTRPTETDNARAKSGRSWSFVCEQV